MDFAIGFKHFSETISMRILMTSSGGIIREIKSWPEYGLAKELVKKGHEVTVFSSSSAMKKHDAKKEETIEGIKAKRFNPLSPANFFHILKKEYDVLHMHHLGYMAPISSYGMLANKARKKPTVFTMHGIYHNPYIVKNVDDPFSAKITRNIQTNFPYFRPWKITNWFAHLPLKADKITALTQWEKNELLKFGVEENRINVIPNGIDLKKYYARKSKNFLKNKFGIDGEKLLFVGQPARRKGWEYFVRAMPHVLKEHPDAKAVFIGYRSDKSVENLCRELGVEKNTVFLGFLKEDEKIAAYQSSDLFVFPTLYEGFGIIFLEAMASGLPIVTTNTAGNNEIVENGKNGLLTKCKDEQAVSDAIVKLLSDRRMMARIRKNNIKKSKSCDWKNVAKNYMEVYESVVK